MCIHKKRDFKSRPVNVVRGNLMQNVGGNIVALRKENKLNRMFNC